MHERRMEVEAETEVEGGRTGAWEPVTEGGRAGAQAGEVTAMGEPGTRKKGPRQLRAWVKPATRVSSQQ